MYLVLGQQNGRSHCGGRGGGFGGGVLGFAHSSRISVTRSLSLSNLSSHREIGIEAGTVASDPGTPWASNGCLGIAPGKYFSPCLRA